MFDLPVVAEADRKAATAFRLFLLNEGFEMSQFSIYLRHCCGKEQAEHYYQRIEWNLPSGGKVHILTFTDKQFEKIIRFHNCTEEAPQKNPEQLLLF